MHIRYIGHAGVAIDVAGRHVVCDPWWNGPAFAGQWHPFPRPRPEPVDAAGADIVCLSHGHEDHLHVPTLRLLRRDALVLVPRLREPGLRDFVRSLGFLRVLEMPHREPVEVAPGLLAAMYVLRDDSILVLEGDGRTLVNANDALQSAPRPVVDDLCDTLRAKHPRADTFIGQCGTSGWFPHGIHITDDVGFDAAAHELAAQDRFAATVHRLGARTALPLAPSFLSLDDPSRAANGARLDATAMRAALRRAGAEDIALHLLSPGDRLVKDQLRPFIGPRPSADDMAAALGTELAVAVAERRQHRIVEPARLDALLAALRANARRRAARVLRDCAPLRCRIDLRDVPEASFLVDASARGAEVSRCDRLRLAPLVLSTRLEVLEALAHQDCGDEAIRLGGGATLQLRRRDLPLREPLVALLGRRPLPPSRGEAAAAWLRDPRRAHEAWRRDRHVRRLVRRLVLEPLSPGSAAAPRPRRSRRLSSDRASAS
jgi:hypothetical protein